MAHKKRSKRNFGLKNKPKDYGKIFPDPKHSQICGRVMPAGGAPKVFGRKTG